MEASLKPSEMPVEGFSGQQDENLQGAPISEQQPSANGTERAPQPGEITRGVNGGTENIPADSGESTSGQSVQTEQPAGSSITEGNSNGITAASLEQPNPNIGPTDSNSTWRKVQAALGR